MRRLILKLFRRRRLEQDLEAELAFHQEQAAIGGNPIPLGNRTKILDASRDSWRFVVLEDLWRDLVYAARSLGKSPGFTSTVIVTLALGIGGVTAMYSIVYGTLLRPLPYPDPDRLVAIWQDDELFGGRGLVAVDNARDLREITVAFENVGAYRSRSLLWNEEDSIEAENVPAVSIDPEMLSVLGAGPILGRGFLAQEYRPEPSAAILTHDFWRRRFGSDPEVLGRTLRMSTGNLTVVGVMPEDFRFNALQLPAGGGAPLTWQPQILLPFAPSPSLMQAGRQVSILQLVGRLNDGVSIERAQEDLDRVAAGLQEKYPEIGGNRYRVVPLKDEVGGSVRAIVLLFFGAVGLVLLIAVANVANLLVTRAVNREREIALRLAIGSTPSRMIRMLVTESLVFSLAWALAGVVLAQIALGWLITRLPAGFPRLDEIAIDRHVLAFTAVLAIATGVAFGLTPAFLGFRTSINRRLHEGTRGHTEGVRQVRFRNLLVAGEIALAVVLLAAAGLVGQSFWNLVNQDLGMDPKNILYATVRTGQPRSDRLEGVQFYEEVVGRLEQFPAVASASYGSGTIAGYSSLTVEETMEAKEDSQVFYGQVAPGYFQTLGVSLASGRIFDETASDEVLVNERMAREFWSGVNPVGRRFFVGSELGPDNSWLTVVGVVSDFKTGLTASEVSAAFFGPCGEGPRGVSSGCNVSGLVVRTRNDPAEAIELLRSEIAAVDAEATLTQVRTSDEIFDTNVTAPRLGTALFGIFAGTALLLTFVGVYGVTSYAAARRIREVCVRMALGATRSEILRLLLMKQAMPSMLLGLSTGLVGAAVLMRLLAAYLYEVQPGNPRIFVMALFTVAIAALFASFMPIRRASAADPTVALRSE